MNIKKYLTPITILIAILLEINSFSISPAVKSYRDYAFTLNTLRSVRIMVENFGDDGLKKKYAEIKALFQEAGENYYGQDFTTSQLKFRKVKLELISLLETLSSNYLNRTKEILDSTSKETFDILIEYSKHSGLAEYFRKPFDPLRDVKAYEVDKYHYFHDRQKIESYLKNGFKDYQNAKLFFNDPEIVLLKKKKKFTSKNMDYIIKRYMDVIFLCRQAKKVGIEIHKIKNINELGKSLIKYDISHGRLIPIYDDRIPEKYKVDANDNLRFIHSVELKRVSKNARKDKDDK